ncbi:pentatricopeptide repeat-containing protein At2g17210 [Brachypodium distachyon]|uniref:pentatricopeptide repeat-containing protein At2g17210 n=1 Tax=Brachypodium distachyon TaxID=15368 RepID=UPI00052FFB59|nr:pentatricopeptide repeat-containing protein At2g17210 [Brachypodium distachyon]|eukprot:XP_010236928.1 pentatricopeptide repeat-containing protein At2g17210 [Brachypodium distachyon]
MATVEAAVRRYLESGKPPALLPALFKHCCLLPKENASAALASQLHADACKRPLSAAASNSLLSCYLRTARHDLAVAHFRCPSTPRDDVTYNTLFAHLPPSPPASFFASLRFFRPNVATLLALVRASSDYPTVVHAYLLKTAYSHMGGTTLQNSLLAMYAAFGDSLAAATLFDEMPDRDVVSWTSMIGASLAGGSADQALGLFRDMVADGTLELDGVVLVVAIRACAMLEHAALGSSLHAVAERRGLQGDDVFVPNSLVDMYAKCHDLHSARKVFDLMAHRNVVSWNSMLSGLVHADRCEEALELAASSSLLTGNGDVYFDETTLVVLLQLCKKLDGQAMWCRSVHATALRRLLSLSSMPLVNALLDTYAKCGLLDYSLRLFEGMREKNVVTWSTLIAGCAHNGRPQEAMACYVAMREAGEMPNSITMLSLLEACAYCAEMRASRCAHGVAIRSGLALERDVSNALVDMYGKCGDIAASTSVFDMMPSKDVLTWNSMIGALGMNGRTLDALAILDRMEREDEGVNPNGITMLTVLSACAHGGLVEEGMACFERMTATYSLQPQVEHLSCVVDMLARVGDLEGAVKIIEERMSTTNSPAAWSALLSACRSHSDFKVGRDAASRVLELEPGNSAGYLLSMSMPGETARMRWLMRERGVKVTSGHSVVYIGQEAHRFVSWDGCHPHRAQVYSMLHLVHQQILPPTHSNHRLHHLILSCTNATD